MFRYQLAVPPYLSFEQTWGRLASIPGLALELCGTGCIAVLFPMSERINYMRLITTALSPFHAEVSRHGD